MEIRMDTLIGKEIIMTDAILLGTVQDLRCEDLKWNILGLRVKTSKSSGLGRSSVLLEPGNFTIGDVILIRDTTDTVRSSITPDDSGILSLSSMIGMKVYGSDAFLLGTIESINIDTSKWRASSFTVKLDKDAYQPLEVKKGLISSKRASGLNMTDIEGVSDTIVLKKNLSKLKSHIVIS